MILIQELVTCWSKTARSAKKATARNATPKTFVVPQSLTQMSAKYAVCLQAVRFCEENSFEAREAKPKIEALTTGGLHQSDCLTLRLADTNKIEISFVWTVDCGAPPRKRRVLGAIDLGQWACFTFNGRDGMASLTRHGEWAYHQTVLNVAFVEKAPSDLFTASRPVFAKKDLADLW